MRIKFLSVITCFLTLCIAFSACLDSDNDYKYTTDVSVYAFGIDTIYGKHYKFSIDQIEHRIFNRDSLPMYADTLLDSIVVDTFSIAAGAITSGDMDTIFVVGEAVDLTAAVNNPVGLGFKVHALDGMTSRVYRLTINVHKQDPDSMIWKNMTSAKNFPTAPLNEDVKLLNLGDYLYLYSSNNGGTAYKANVSEPTNVVWEALTLDGMPQDVILNTMLVAFDALFVVAQDGSVYQSADGASWQMVEGLSGDVQALLTAFPTTLAGIKQVDGENYFCTTDASLQWAMGEKVEEGFPTKNIQSTIHQTSNGVYKSVLVGTSEKNSDSVIPWFSMDGNSWASMEPSADNYCPLTDRTSIIYYGDTYYLFDAGLYAFYSSPNGLVWKMETGKIRFPYSLRDALGYSAAIDKNNFIWIVGGGNGIISNQLWRGRINRLGFERQ